LTVERVWSDTYQPSRFQFFETEFWRVLLPALLPLAECVITSMDDKAKLQHQPSLAWMAADDGTQEQGGRSRIEQIQNALQGVTAQVGYMVDVLLQPLLQPLMQPLGWRWA
jgi:hypothetical protein